MVRRGSTRPRSCWRVIVALIKVLIADPAVAVRSTIEKVLTVDSGVEVVGTAATAQMAVRKAERARPEVAVVSVGDADLDGIALIAALKKLPTTCRIIALCRNAAMAEQISAEATAAGAAQVIPPAPNYNLQARVFAHLTGYLMPAVQGPAGGGRERRGGPGRAGARGGARIPAQPTGAQGNSATHTSRPAGKAVGSTQPALLAIGSSTGGPQALLRVLSDIPGNLPVPVVITQHMPPVFTKQLAERLDRETRHTVVEAENHMPITKGTVYVAPGDYHLTVERVEKQNRISLNQGAPVNFCRPAVDVMFNSVSTLYGAQVVAAILTGMGGDGTQGAQAIRAGGGYVVVQDEATSVVWGMPGSAVKAGQFDAELSLDKIGSHLARRVTGRGAGAARK